jgi:hypothetical protein
MCDIITLSMFDAMSRKSTEVPSPLTRKIASPGLSNRLASQCSEERA